MSSPESSLDLRLRGYQKVIDRYFTHLTTGQVAKQDGFLDVARERDRLGVAVVNSALENIKKTLVWRTQRHTIYQIDSTLDALEHGRFPAFTSCLDEAAIFLAITMTGMPSLPLPIGFPG